ncbi:bifunctional methylenetetrahydrofolate dehydrogenase/methenyltetrahydrofolate cyclohydrolase [Candidatus Peregrinibacteria bacterium]|nr:MAG: bifunctional methylenetetrahydrofolate dehydrogenase/methenyltetrahydrofolate cyclohydrolase [Candidatus Peregrinibacteria bacterium]
MILNGKILAQELLESLSGDIKKYQPHLAIILVGDDPASHIYVRHKQRTADKHNIQTSLFQFDAATPELTVLQTLEDINNNPEIHGCIVQLPLPQHISSDKIFSLLNPKKDVDGFSFINMGKTIAGQTEHLKPATPQGIMTLLSANNIEISGKNTVVIGRSNIVGKPMAALMINAGATVTVCNSKTKNLSHFTKNADIIIAATGQKKLVQADMIKPGVVIVDVGISRTEDGKLCGDVDFHNVVDIASAITPVPGGVGPMTIAQLLTNTVQAAKTLQTEA